MKNWLFSVADLLYLVLFQWRSSTSVPWSVGAH